MGYISMDSKHKQAQLREANLHTIQASVRALSSCICSSNIVLSVLGVTILAVLILELNV